MKSFIANIRREILDADKFAALELYTKTAFKNALITKIAFLTHPLVVAEFDERMAFYAAESISRSQLITEKNEPLRHQILAMENTECVFIAKEESINFLLLAIMQLAWQESANRHMIEISEFEESELHIRQSMESASQSTLFSIYDERDGFDNLQSPVKTPNTFEPAPPGL